MHIGLILDGNRRWAKSLGRSVAAGHQEGIDNFERITRFAAEHPEISTISAFALSTENLQRGALELANLFSIFSSFATTKAQEMIACGGRVHVLGNLELLPKNLQKDLRELEEKTKDGKKLVVNLCIAFGGRDEIVRAAKVLSESEEEITEDSLAHQLDSAHSPPMDLLIRTGGKKRISNFMIWEAAYAELSFSSKMWPEFTPEDLQDAIDFYKDQKRTFGK